MLGILEAKDAGFMPHFRIDKHRSFSHWKLYIPMRWMSKDHSCSFRALRRSWLIIFGWLATSLATCWLLVEVAGQVGRIKRIVFISAVLKKNRWRNERRRVKGKEETEVYQEIREDMRETTHLRPRGIRDLNAGPGVGWLVRLSGCYFFF